MDFKSAIKFETLDVNDNFACNVLIVKEEIQIEQETLYKETYQQLNQYESLTSEAPRLCPICHKVFPSSYSYLQHNSEHLKILVEKLKLYTCGQCDRYFFTETDLYSHGVSAHINNKINKHKCDLCGVVIGSVANLRRHILNIHMKKYKMCEFCGKNVKRTYYKDHKRKVHQTDKVKCDLCCKLFKSQFDLERHVIFIHDKLSLSKTLECSKGVFKCDTCSECFKNMDELRKHIRYCGGEICRICNAKLKNNIILKNHMLWVHCDDGESHHCELCDKLFKSVYSLRTHMKTHLSAKKKLLKDKKK